MHARHLTGCAIAFGLALVLFTITGGSIGGLGLLLAVLICPLTMGVVMWFLVGSQRREASPSEDAPPATDAAPSAR